MWTMIRCGQAGNSCCGARSLILSTFVVLERFRKRNKFWVEDYALYMALKEKMNGRPWPEWEEGLRLRDPETLEVWKKRCKEEVDYHVFTQYLFFQQWSDLKKYANEKGVKIIGDAPIYVAMDSADVWAHPELFQLDENNLPTLVAGCPPDAFSEDGQLWGNPLYNWDVMKEDGYAWWMERIQANLTMYDVLRIDHFRGLESYYAIPYGDTTAQNGHWCKGPGMDFIRAIRNTVGDAPIIAEDLGMLTPAVHRLLKNSGYPGMKVLQFAFNASEESTYLPHNLPNHCVVYTGTHDNDTTRGWLDSASPEDLEFAMEYLGLEDLKEGNWAFIRQRFPAWRTWPLCPSRITWTWGLRLGSTPLPPWGGPTGGGGWQKTAPPKNLPRKWPGWPPFTAAPGS